MSNDQNKSEKPTPHKLKEAREKGQVSKSTEFNAVFSMFFFLILAFGLHESWFDSIKDLAKNTLISAGHVSNKPNVLFEFLSETSTDFYAVIFPALFVLVLLAFMSNIFQIGFIFTTFTIKADFKKLNPAANIKKIFTKKTIFELIKSLIKILFFSAFLYFSVDTVVENSLLITATPPDKLFYVWSDLFFSLAIKLLILLIVIALLDYSYNKWDFSKQMMMSTNELKDEHKKHEGDPEIKSKRKQVQKELLEKSASLSNVKNADIIITNPTHIAVALQYDINAMAAPKVVAMGKGELASKIRIQAKRYRVPTIQNKLVARQLYKECRVNNYIPLTCFDKVAPIFRWLFAMREQSIHG